MALVTAGQVNNIVDSILLVTEVTAGQFFTALGHMPSSKVALPVSGSMRSTFALITPELALRKPAVQLEAESTTRGKLAALTNGGLSSVTIGMYLPKATVPASND